ncbi:STAS/SEC14 domain-containing protein [Gallaecimonas sp. GXIMD4217]|uniref:STAS/SEC14 domain-containing protein n=1 Tax=Gallaecimonas sp. GXIMD4217 TaxID=3131927 RepID=UPI00311AE4F7
MITALPRSQGNALAFHLSDHISHDDYQRVLVPAIDKALVDHPHVLVMLIIDETFQGFSPRALWDDARLGLSHWNGFAGLALVGGPAWLNWALTLFAPLMHCPVRLFAPEATEEAWLWLNSLPAPGSSSRS